MLVFWGVSWFTLSTSSQGQGTPCRWAFQIRWRLYLWKTNNWKSSSKDKESTVSLQNGSISLNLPKLHDSYKILEIFIKHIHRLSHEIMPSTETHAHKVIRNRHLQGVTSELDMAIPWKCHETSHPPHFPPSEKKKQPKHSRIRTSKIVKWYEMTILQKHSFLKKIPWKHVRSKNQTNQLLHCEGQWVAGLVQTPRVTACYQCCWSPRTPARLPAIECDNSSAMIWSVVLPTNLHW